MPDVVTQINLSIANDLKTRWGGRLPTWDEFKTACKSGRVRGNKNIGIKAIWLKGVPKSFVILFGIVTASAVFIIPVACIVLSISRIFRWWSIVAGLLASWFLYKVTLEGAADAIKYGAERSEPLYQMLVTRGAFLFDRPAELPPMQTNADLLGALGELMEQYPTALLDATRLPASKQKMKEVIREVWREQPKIRGALTQAYLHLSQFQDGIGDAVVLDCKLPEQMTPAELLGPQGENFRQWTMWSKVSLAEMEILKQEWENFERSSAPA